MNTTTTAPASQVATESPKAEVPKYGPRQEESNQAYANRILGEKNFYRHVARELMADGRRLLGLSYAQAERLGRQFLVDMGRFEAKQVAEGISLGKVDKNGATTLKVTMAKLKGVHYTPTFNIAKICAILNETATYGIETFDKVTLHKTLNDWLADTKE